MPDTSFDSMLDYIQSPPNSPKNTRKTYAGTIIFFSFIFALWLLCGLYFSPTGGRLVLYLLIELFIILFCIWFLVNARRAEQNKKVLYKELQHRIERMTNAEKQRIAEDFTTARAFTNFSMRLGKEYLYTPQSNLLLPLSSITEIYEECDFYVNDDAPDDYWIEITLVTTLCKDPLMLYRSPKCPSRDEAAAHRRLCVLQQQPELAHVSFRKRS